MRLWLRRSHARTLKSGPGAWALAAWSVIWVGLYWRRKGIPYFPASFFSMPALWWGRGGGIWEQEQFRRGSFFSMLSFHFWHKLRSNQFKLTLSGERTRDLKCTLWAQREVNRGRELFFDVGVEKGSWSRWSYSRGNMVLIALSIILEWITMQPWTKLHPVIPPVTQCRPPLSKQRILWNCSRSSLHNCLRTFFGQWPQRNIADEPVLVLLDIGLLG